MQNWTGNVFSLCGAGLADVEGVLGHKRGDKNQVKSPSQGSILNLLTYIWSTTRLYFTGAMNDNVVSGCQLLTALAVPI